jgi:hypothetical protein
MSLLLDAPVAPAPQRLRTRRRSLLPALAALIGVAGLSWSALSLAPRAAAFSEVHPTVIGAPFVTVPEYGPRGSYILGYQHKAPVTMTVPVHNDGRLPITITSAAINGGPEPLLSIDAVQGLPLSLGAGESGQLVLTGRLINCRFFHERAVETYDGIELGFSSLGASATRHVRFDRPLLVHSPMLASCPDRKLNRQANSRSALVS